MGVGAGAERLAVWRCGALWGRVGRVGVHGGKGGVVWCMRGGVAESGGSGCMEGEGERIGTKRWKGRGLEEGGWAVPSEENRVSRTDKLTLPGLKQTPLLSRVGGQRNFLFGRSS